MQERYNFAEIEPKWQAWWDERGQYEVHEAEEAPMAYVLEQFPYPSGDRLHMGHARVYSLGDALARYLTMRGFRVLHPMGWDAFGLPAENAAIKRHVHPALWTEENIAYMRDHQMRKLGYSYDWKREVTTCRPDYYRWTQWLFLEFYKGGKAYRKAAAVNWCPGCDTVLANEQVHDGKCWRCDSVVTKKNLTQWFLKITDYAEQLLEGLDELPKWPDKVKAIQRHWIGKSQGAEIDFPLAGHEAVTVFTTRPDTLLGVTYVVLAPEHPLVERLAGNDPTVAAFREEVARLTEIERTSTERPKGGVPIGAHLTHPLTGEEIPIWTADYVLLEYGTGAVMGVPAHDERDYVFAKTHGLPIKPVIRPKAGEWLEDAAFTEAGVMVHSPGYDGLESEAAKQKIVQDLEGKGLGRSRVTYRLRDWLVSRQRYWGAPIPMIHCDRCGVVPVPDDQLPVVLPDNVQFSGKGQSPLASVADFVNTVCPTCQGAARRDTDTMDTFMCSSWYYLRYPDPHNTCLPFDKDKADAWLPVDEYVGGMEHAAMHLLYSRFFTRYLCDRGRLSFKEPFTSLLTQGTITRGGLRMSKSKGNVVSPDELMREYGADTIRVYILFAAPPEKDLEWSDAGVEGAYRFLQRVWRQAKQILDGAGVETAPGNELHVLTHKTIQNVSRDYEERAFNTVVSSLMILSNGIQDALLGDLAPAGVLREALEALVLMLAPIAPHVSEELWHLLGHTTSVHRSNWPTFDPKALVTDEVEIAVQINGKVRDRLKVPTSASNDEIKALVLATEAVQSQLNGKRVHDVIVVPNRLANVVVK